MTRVTKKLQMTKVTWITRMSGTSDREQQGYYLDE